MSNETVDDVAPAPISYRDPRVKWLAAAIMILALVVGVGGIAVIKLVQNNATTQATNHTNRLSDQARTDAEIRGIITCIITQTNPGDDKKCLEAFLKKHPAPVPPKPSASGMPGAAGSGVSTPTDSAVVPGATRTNSVPTKPVTTAPRRVAAPAAPKTTPAARKPTPTSAPAPRTSAQPSPVLSVGHICVLGVCVT